MQFDLNFIELDIPKIINRDFYLVFTPKNTKKRFLISANQLGKYISNENANKLLIRLLNIDTDKGTCKYRKYGKIDFYTK